MKPFVFIRDFDFSGDHKFGVLAVKFKGYVFGDGDALKECDIRRDWPQAEFITHAEVGKRLAGEVK